MPQPFSTGARVSIAAILFVAGFIFPLLFIVAAILVWSIVADHRRPKDVHPNEWFDRRWSVTAEDNDWVSCFLPICESPAETAFLEAMIPAFDLKPEKGVLRSETLKLDLQARIPPYRVDFLANDWLVIEIDGAAYHSSPEAIARDKARDKDLQSGPYTVLRIPAKVIFTAPGDAVERVKTALLSGRIPRGTVAEALRDVSLPKAKGVLAGLAGAAEQFTSYMATNLAVQQAMKPVELATACEKGVLDSAINLARSRIEIEGFRKRHGLDQEFIDQARRDLDEAIQRRGGQIQMPCPVVDVPVIVRPGPHNDPLIDSAIQQRFDEAMAARAKYYADIAHQLASDDRLPNLILPSLQELGRENFWDLFVAQMANANFRLSIVLKAKCGSGL